MIWKIICAFLVVIICFLFIGIQNLMSKNGMLEQEIKNLKMRINRILGEEVFKIER